MGVEGKDSMVTKSEVNEHKLEISDLTSKFIEAHFNVEGKPIKNIKLWVEVVESMADILDERSFA